MTEVAFHFGAPDKLAYACRLLRKAYGSGARVVVVAEPDQVLQLDTDLWGVAPADFIPHCCGTAEAAVKERSHVVLVSDTVDYGGTRDVMVNLAESVPVGFDQFNRLIEVVSMEEADRNQARQRWKYYTERGYAITRHDLTSARAG